MRYSSRFFLYAPLVLLLVLAAAAGLQWWREAGAWSKKIDALNGREIAPGITLHFASRQLAGFPFRLDTVFKDFRLSFAGPRAFQWRSEEFALHRLSYDGNKTVFEAAGIQSLSWLGLDGKTAEFRFLPGSVRADAITQGGKLARFDLVVVALDSPKLTAGRVEVHLRHDQAGDVLDLVAFAKSVSLSNGKTFEYAKADSRIIRAQFFSGLLSGNADWRTVLEAWRGGEGRIDLVDVRASHDAATGRLKLDGSHALTGVFTRAVLNTERFESLPLY